MASNCFFHLTGGLGNTNPNNSLGGVASGNRLSTIAMSNLFANVNPGDTDLGQFVTYRAIDIKNEGDGTAQNINFFFTDTTSTESTLSVWYEVSPGQSISDEFTPPVGASWSEPNISSKLAISDITPGAIARLWIRRVVAQNAAQNENDLATLHVWFT